MSKTPNVDKFLSGYRKAALNDADKALAIMLELNAEEIEPLFESKDPLWLHKAFRQTDVTDSASKDMVIWHLIHAAPMFWDELHSFWGMLERRDRKNKIRALEEERDELLVLLVEARNSVDFHCEEYGSKAQEDLLVRIDAAIAKAKGSTENHSPDAGKMVPDGWQLVPVSPTAEMLEAAADLPIKATRGMHDAACYKVMLAAAPKPEGGAA